MLVWITFEICSAPSKGWGGGTDNGALVVYYKYT